MEQLDIFNETTVLTKYHKINAYVNRHSDDCHRLATQKENEGAANYVYYANAFGRSIGNLNILLYKLNLTEDQVEILEQELQREIAC